MARDPKRTDVEAQQDAAAAERPARAPSLDDAAPATTRATLMLARTRALAGLQQACAPAQRAMFEQAIADLDARLAASPVVERS